jgi:hypothetical protein
MACFSMNSSDKNLEIFTGDFIVIICWTHLGVRPISHWQFLGPQPRLLGLFALPPHVTHHAANLTVVAIINNLSTPLRDAY